MEDEKVEVTFTVNRPSDAHRAGVRQLCAETCKVLAVDVFDLTDAIVEQQNVGNIVCVDGGDDETDGETADEASGEEKETPSAVNAAAGAAAPADEAAAGALQQVVVGVFTLLNLRQFWKVLGALGAAITKSKNRRLCDVVAAGLQGGVGKEVGVLLMERLPTTGLPKRVCLNAFKECVDDVAWTRSLDVASLEPEEVAELPFYEYGYILGLCWGYEVAENAVACLLKRHKGAAEDDAVVARVEVLDPDAARLFKLRTAAITVDARTTTKSNAGQTMRKHLVVFALPYKAFVEAVSGGRCPPKA